LVLGQVTVNLGVETEPLVVVTTIAPDRAPAGIVRVIAVGEVELGVILTPFNFTLRIELNPVPLIVTEVKAGPLVTDNPPDALIRGKTETEGV
jgi:hypothetical protein